MTSRRWPISFGWLTLPLAGLALALALAPQRAGHAAPVRDKPRAPKKWPKTTPADRKRSANNLKLIALAFHNYADVYAALPAAANADKKGKALLSWRVAILPYIEEDALYKEFRLNESWDSAHNKKLLRKMPKIYGLPKVRVDPEYGTFYRVFTGPDAPFNPPAVRGRAAAWPPGPRFPAGFPDGTSNTFLVVEAGEAVPWSKPEELAYDARKPVPKLGGLFREGFHAAYADGSVKFIDPKIKERDLRALVTAAGGEVVGDVPEATPAKE
jgi:hypothetical protein